MKKIWLALTVNSVLGGLFFTWLQYSEYGNLPRLPQDGREVLLSILLANLAGAAVAGFNHLLNRLISWKKHTFLRFVSGLLLNFGLYCLVLFGLPLLYIYMDAGPGEVNWLRQTLSGTLAGSLVVLFFGMFTFTIVDFTLFSYRQYAVVQLQQVQLTRKQLELQYEMLKSQLSPHYLFNCLNTISSLVYKSPELAGEFIRHFAVSWQYVLDTHQRKLVKLSEEVEFVRSYIFLMKVRFDEGLQVQIDLPPEVLQTEIPPLTLQLLVENAVKHNIISGETPLKVVISVDQQQQLQVQNNKTTPPASQQSFQIGLSNICRRYGYFTSRPVKVVNEALFTVQLPLLTTLSRGQ